MTKSAASRPRRLTLSQALEVISCICAHCGGPAEIFPYPRERGTCVCQRCSPGWLRPFVVFATEALRRELGVTS